MAETPKPQDQEAFKAFVKHYNLDPLNKEAINNCLFDIAKHIMLPASWYAMRWPNLAESFK